MKNEQGAGTKVVSVSMNRKLNSVRSRRSYIAAEILRFMLTENLTSNTIFEIADDPAPALDAFEVDENYARNWRNVASVSIAMELEDMLATSTKKPDFEVRQIRSREANLESAVLLRELIRRDISADTVREASFEDLPQILGAEFSDNAANRAIFNNVQAIVFQGATK
jgi:hypothetical protein